MMQLKPFASSRNLHYAGGPSLTFDDEGRSVTLSYSYNSGTVDGYDVTVPVANTPEVLLRAETSTDRTGKERSINVEAQVGEAVFDRAIYIETGASEEAVQQMLPPEVRAAVLGLMEEGVRDLKLGERRVAFNVPDSASRAIFNAESIERVVALTRAFSWIPHVDPSTPVEAERGAGVVAATVTLTVFGLGWLVLATVSFPPEDSWLWMVSMLGGLLIWFLARPGIAKLTRGHSRSYRRYLFTLGFSFVGLPALCAAAAISMNAGFDHRPELVREGRLTHATSDDEGTSITVQWTDDRSTTETNRFFTSMTALMPGARVVGRFRQGALGARWRERKFEVLPSPVTVPSP